MGKKNSVLVSYSDIENLIEIICLRQVFNFSFGERNLYSFCLALARVRSGRHLTWPGISPQPATSSSSSLSSSAVSLSSSAASSSNVVQRILKNHRAFPIPVIIPRLLFESVFVLKLKIDRPFCAPSILEPGLMLKILSKQICCSASSSRAPPSYREIFCWC